MSDAPEAPQPQTSPRTRSAFSIKIGRFFGIDVIIHWSFWLLFVYVAWITYANPNATTAMFLQNALLISCVFVCVVLHEFGHALTARRFGIQTRDVTLLPIGGVARLEGMPEKPSQEILVALAGPAVNVVIAAILFPIAIGIRGMPNAADFDLAGGEFLATLAAINIFLVIFNLIPAFPMDGGRVLRAALAIKMGRVEATRAAAGVGQALAILFAIAGIFWSPILILIGIFVFFGGRAEAQMVTLQAAFAGLTVERAMMTEFHVLHKDTALGQAADELLAGSQHEFPVVDGDGHLGGILTREALLRGVEQLGSDAPVERAMQPSNLVFSREMPLRKAVEQMQLSQVSAAPVVDDGRVIGLLTLENAGEFAALRQAASARRRTA